MSASRSRPVDIPGGGAPDRKKRRRTLALAAAATVSLVGASAVAATADEHETGTFNIQVAITGFNNAAAWTGTEFPVTAS